MFRKSSNTSLQKIFSQSQLLIRLNKFENN
jgi:hypothetical protein